MKLVEIDQVWSNDALSAYNPYVWVVVKIEGRKVYASKINLANGVKEGRVVLTYCSLYDGIYYSPDLQYWKLITDKVVHEQLRRLEWADKYL